MGEVKVIEDVLNEVDIPQTDYSKMYAKPGGMYVKRAGDLLARAQTFYGFPDISQEQIQQVARMVEQCVKLARRNGFDDEAELYFLQESANLLVEPTQSKSTYSEDGIRRLYASMGHVYIS